MFASLHALALIAVAAFAVSVPLRSTTAQWNNFREFGYLLFPILILGVVASSLLSANGKPLAEWIVPGIAGLMLVTFGKNKRLVVGSLVGMFAIAVILSGSFLFLLSTGYATSVDSIKSLVALRNRGALKTASSKLAARYPAMNFPEMPLESIDNELSPGRLDTVSTERLWHTFFTRLYRVDRKPALIWYPGGDVLTASKQLEIRGVD